jgi:hypothetical protein
VATPTVETLTGATQVPPGTRVNVEPTGNWSLVARLVVAPTVPPFTTAVSLSASMIVIRLVVLLLPPVPVPPLLSLVAPVVPVTVTSSASVSVPPAVPGIKTVIGQLKVAPTGRLAAVPLEATHSPGVTVAPLLPVVVQVALVAAAGPALVHTMLPVTVAPGAAVVGKPVMTGLMSETKTVIGALAAVPVVATGPVAVGVVVLFVTNPGVLEVTLICAAQVPVGARLAVLKRKLVSPATLALPSILVTVPQAGGVKIKVALAKVRPPGKVSSTDRPVMLVGLIAGLPKVSVITAVPPGAIPAGLMLLATVGAA